VEASPSPVSYWLKGNSRSLILKEILMGFFLSKSPKAGEFRQMVSSVE
jgi:hypothetical protein